MKKLLSFLLCIVLAFSVVGCADPGLSVPALAPSTYQVPNPMSYPDYTFDNTPSTMDLRMTAVQAMHDLLSIQWHTEETITYKKTGPGSNNAFKYEPGKVYGGLLYSSASTGVFQFLEFYNQENGRLEYPDNSDSLKNDIGSACADSLLWAWATVSNSFKGGYFPLVMVPKNGYHIVGDYKFNTNIDTYYALPSDTIIKQNSKDTIMKSYAKILPADALISNTENHAMMATTAATVVYKSNGTIDTAKSYIMIQDQRMGGEKWQVKENGVTIGYGGRLNAKYTFDDLYKASFIPVTAAEFIGLDPYEKAAVTTSGPDCNSIKQLSEITVEANYPLAVINVLVTDKKGTQVVAARKLFGGAATAGPAKSFKLGDLNGLSKLSDTKLYKKGYTVEIEVVVSTGERFVPIEFKI